MSTNNDIQQVKVVVADPSALGLFGLAMVTLVASSQKLGITTGLSFVLPWAFFLGGAAQLFACVHDAKKNNAFGTTAFGAYGLFWFAVGLSWLFKMGALGPELQQAVDGKQLGLAFVGYLIFNAVMTIGAMETHKALFTIFFLINFLFIGLAMDGLGIGGSFGHQLAAWSELLISIASFYGFAANVLNTHFGREFIPVGKPFGIFKK